MKHSTLILGTLLGGLVFGCAFAPTAPLPQTSTQSLSADSASGRLTLRVGNMGDRRVMAFSEDLKRLEVTIYREGNSGNRTSVGTLSLDLDNENNRLSYLNLLPGQYRFSVLAYDRAGNLVQYGAPQPYLTKLYEVSSYQVAYVDLLVPLKSTLLTSIAFPDASIFENLDSSSNPSTQSQSSKRSRDPLPAPSTSNDESSTAPNTTQPTASEAPAVPQTTSEGSSSPDATSPQPEATASVNTTTTQPEAPPSLDTTTPQPEATSSLDVPSPQPEAAASPSTTTTQP